MSTSNPRHSPALSGNANPAKFGFTPQRRVPRDLTTSSLADWAHARLTGDNREKAIPAKMKTLRFMTATPAIDPVSDSIPINSVGFISAFLPAPLNSSTSQRSKATTGGCGLDRLSEKIHRGVDLTFGCGGRRNEAKDAAVASRREDQSVLEAIFCDGLTLARRRFLGEPVAYKFDAHKLTAPANITDDLITLLEHLQAFAHVSADLARLRGHVLVAN